MCGKTSNPKRQQQRSDIKGANTTLHELYTLYFVLLCFVVGFFTFQLYLRNQLAVAQVHNITIA